MSKEGDRSEEAQTKDQIVRQAPAGEDKPNSHGNTANSGDHERNGGNGHHDAPSFMDRPARVIAIVGVVVALVGLIINYYTLVAIQAQQTLMDGQLGQMKSANGKTDDLIGAANRQASAAETANGYTKQSLSSADRPWVGYQSFVFHGVFENQEIAIGTNLRNSGRSPALSVRARFSLKSQDHSRVPDDISSCNGCSERTLFPGDF